MMHTIQRLFSIMIMWGGLWPICMAGDSIDHRLFNHVVNAPEKAEKSKKRFIKYLRLEAHNDTEMVESIYYWMTYNIAYDVSLYDKTEDFVLTDSFFSRKGICAEYSRLFVQLCELAGIEVEFLSGYAKTNTPVSSESPGIRHAWNRVKLNGQWRLVDVTWGTRSRLKGNGVERKQPNLSYLFISPEDLIKTHFPYKAEWQMLAKPVTESEFIKS